MKTKNTTSSLLALLGVLFFAASAAEASELPPSGSKPLSAIIQSVEKLGLGAVTDADLENGLWEVEACKERSCTRLDLDPRTAQERSRRNDDSDDALPPAGAKPLSEIIRSVEAQNLGTITDVELDDGSWEIELRKEGRKVKLDVDPVTGKTRG